MKELENFYLTQEEPNRGVYLALRDYFLGFDKNISAEWKFQLPFFYYKGKMFSYLWKDKKTNQPYVGVVQGSKISHPLLESGDRKMIKILRIDPLQDLPLESMNEIFIQSIKLLEEKLLRPK